MKTRIVETVKEPKVFEPVTIELTFESQEELDGLRSLFYLSAITTTMQDIFSFTTCDIHEILAHAGGRTTLDMMKLKSSIHDNLYI